jgi:hypothetical protein
VGEAYAPRPPLNGLGGGIPPPLINVIHMTTTIWLYKRSNGTEERMEIDQNKKIAELLEYGLNQCQISRIPTKAGWWVL